MGRGVVVSRLAPRVMVHAGVPRVGDAAARRAAVCVGAARVERLSRYRNRHASRPPCRSCRSCECGGSATAAPEGARTPLSRLPALLQGAAGAERRLRYRNRHASRPSCRSCGSCEWSASATAAPEGARTPLSRLPALLHEASRFRAAPAGGRACRWGDGGSERVAGVRGKRWRKLDAGQPLLIFTMHRRNKHLEWKRTVREISHGFPTQPTRDRDAGRRPSCVHSTPRSPVAKP